MYARKLGTPVLFSFCGRFDKETDYTGEIKRDGRLPPGYFPPQNFGKDAF